MRTEAPNVVTTKQFQALLREGYLAEVLANEDAHKVSSVWYGSWIVRVVNEERTYERLVSSTRLPETASEQVRVRVHKTANGLISFLEAAGITHPTVPLKKGGRHAHRLPKKESTAF